MAPGADVAIPAPLLLGFAFAFGACIGSFLNVVIYRVPRGESIVWPPSRCPGCESAIPFWANVPILSWFLLRGRCRSCGMAISPRYVVVEAATALLFVALAVAALQRGVGVQLVVNWALAAALVAVIAIDAEHRIIPNSITYPGMVLGLALAVLLHQPSPLDALLGLMLPAGMMLALAWVWQRWRNEIGLGMGDVKLVAMLGAFLGLEAALGVLILGSVIGLVYGIVLVIRSGEGRSHRIPFGPALALAAIAFLFEPGLMTWVLPQP